MLQANAYPIWSNTFGIGRLDTSGNRARNLHGRTGGKCGVLYSGAHVRLGLKAGTREEAIHAVDTYGPLDGLTEDEALIIRFGRELLEAPRVEDETFDAVRARWGEVGVLDSPP